MPTVHYFIRFLVDFFSLLPMYSFLIGCYYLWRQTYRISLGHYWFGQIAMGALLVLDVLFTFYPGYGPGFRPVVNIALTSWVVYNGWFFRRYPIPWAYLQANVSPVRAAPIYTPRTWLSKRLISTPSSRPYWFSSGFKWVAVIGLFVITSGYFIQKLVALAVISDQRVVDAQEKVDQKFSTAAKEVTKEVTRAVVTAVDTLRKGQEKASDEATFDASRKVNELRESFGADLRAANRRSSQANAKADRALNSPSFTPSPLRPKGVTGEIPTVRVQAQPFTPQYTPRRGRKTSYNDAPFDVDNEELAGRRNH